MPVPDFESFKVAGGEVSSATKFNNLVQAVEDEFADIDQDQITGLAYQTYALAWTSSGTAPALGNAVVSARFAQFGKLVHVSFQITFGSTSTFGTGDYFFSLPVSAKNLIGSFAPIGTAFSFDTSGAVFNTANVLVFNATTIDMQYNAAWPTGAQAVYGATTPWTWANGDSLTVNAVYEAA